VTPTENNRETVSVVIPTFNAARTLRQCLDALTWADAVIVVDMFSTDETPQICRAYPNVRMFQRKGYIYENVNFGFDQANTDWVIRLDSDEVIGDELRKSILHVLARSDPGIAGYRFRKRTYTWGHLFEHGPLAPERNERKHMFRRGTARYPCRAEHEDISTIGAFVTLDGTYDHYTNPTVEETLRKMNYYTERDAERYDASRLERPRVWHILYRCARMFVLYYVQWRGYKDGPAGFFWCFYFACIYPVVEHMKRWEVWKRAQAER
jgi:glycosyltransferase involved in cell wall biosynthesis